VSFDWPLSNQYLNAKFPVKNPDWSPKFMQRHGINQENQGFYLVRHNRQIGRALTLDLFSRHPSLNYFRAEISFSPALDELFGVQTNKSRFTLKGKLKDKLELKFKGVLLR